MEFSQELIDRLKRYFLARFGLEITDEVADEYLGQFAELYGSMGTFAEARARRERGSAAPARPDLISPHS
jgi:hypothetical protein